MQGAASSVSILQDLLEIYQFAAGQFFNLQKSQLHFGKCGSRRKRRISSTLVGVHHPTRLSATSIWESISKENDSNGLQFMAALFITVLFHLWKARNEALFKDRRPALHLIQATLSAAISFSLKQISKPFASPQIRALCASLRIAISH
ncbi:hypothetical protein AAC387_Pa10g0477 [Persea americana]